MEELNMDFKSAAREKLNKEKEKAPNGRIAKAILPATVNALLEFVEQEEEFAQAVAQTDKTVTDCVEEIAKDVKGGSISDLEVFKKAVRFYFTTATVQFVMKLYLTEREAEEGKTAEEKKAGKILSFGLDDLFE